jgi:hypothetical protein
MQNAAATAITKQCDIDLSALQRKCAAIAKN